ncbi:hypothetical protein OMP38_28370 [Cohnella ginsengisoli]|uniref:Uncharacterized protein n=1 Tax=Cohnella ginsengisoli TaxID=425004 RepID=A0A9X4QQA1_9BACL|nr:hypothetical protein [Cohnella ginsengisoli]MDG0794316.1 hypothetical protein [Cohnella ginsengisoli]
MSTRLLSESLVRERFPHLRYVRIHTSGKQTATIYAWDDQLELREEDRANLLKFASAYLTPFVCFKVKPYGLTKEERVPAAPEVPDDVREAAMHRGSDLHDIIDVVDRMLAGGRLSFERYDRSNAIVYLTIRSTLPISPIERELLGVYLYELLPLGTQSSIQYI